MKMDSSLHKDTPIAPKEEEGDQEEVIGQGEGLFRETVPTHFSFKIKPFSLLAKSSVANIESNDFEAGGYKWKLLIYPNGNRDENGQGHISMYLAITDTKSLPPAWEVDVNFRFFLFDQIRDKYLILGDSGGTTRRFHGLKTQWGISKLLPLTTLNDSNGYLVDDSCMFGAEVLVCKSTGSGDLFTMIYTPTTITHTWKVQNFSQIQDTNVYSDEFSVGEYKWKIQVYPKGSFDGTNNSLSFYFWVVNPTSTLAPKKKKLCVDYILRLRSQIRNKPHWEFKAANSWFSSSAPSWGRSKFISLGELNDKKKGFLLKDTCIFEVEVTIQGLLQTF